MAKIVAISGTEGPNEAALVSVTALGWLTILGLTGWIFWRTASPKRSRR